MNSRDIAIALLTISLALLSFATIPRTLTRQAAKGFVRIFKERKATTAASAMGITELIPTPSMLYAFRTRGDLYRQIALNAMVREGVVKMTEDGKLYLCQEKLPTYKLNS